MIIHPRRAILAAVACASLIAACGSGASTNGPSPVAVATSPASPTTSPVSTLAPTPSVAVAATATPDLAHPVGIIAIGHSGLTGEGTGTTADAVPANSWATGTSAQVDSVYLRLQAAMPEIAGHVANTAQGGATADMLQSQAIAALQVVPVPALAIISTIDNDIQCDGTDPQHEVVFGNYVKQALNAIVGASPNTKILIVGQLGRPNIAFTKAWVAKDPSVEEDSMGSDMCAAYDVNDKISPQGFKNLTAIIQGYEDVETGVCKLYPQCHTDGGVRAAWVDKVEYMSLDEGHFNVAGQTAVAANIWPVVKKLMGL